MGLTAVLNDTPEKKAARDEFFRLCQKDKKDDWQDISGSSFSVIVSLASSAGLSDERIARLVSEGRRWETTPSRVATWRAGTQVPLLRTDRNRLIDVLLKELLRIEAAIDHD
ncbi:MAG: hypothetical protein WBK28_03290 [Minisyncoccia bacterium]